jgi:hypothetical protein
VAPWLRRYRDGGLEVLLTYKEASAPTGQKPRPPAVFEPHQARLAPSRGFASQGEQPQGLREEFGLEVPSTTLHGIVRYKLHAKRKRPRPSQAKKPSPRRWTLSNRARAVLAPLPPEAGRSPLNPCGSAARMRVARASTCLAGVGSRAMA